MKKRFRIIVFIIWNSECCQRYVVLWVEIAEEARRKEEGKGKGSREKNSVYRILLPV